MIKFLSKEIQIGFDEVVGNPYKHDDSKMNENWEKLLKERDFFIYSTHWVNGLYLVDQVNGFTIPNTANQLNELSIIINVMLEFKYHVINLKNHINSLLKDKPKFFGYYKTIGELAVNNSPVKKLPVKNTVKRNKTKKKEKPNNN
ncbi:15510_t:CDS:2 [Funneliformis mosseae]|uniref:15510_t:CDS:1 n=1 Tax=Funneliformis mosseae TaxID=27381 RepID=A0A9N9GJL8_FUNMO|nr:15510_t:CDS:2 [Funneliformis mosseae]